MLSHIINPNPFNIDHSCGLRNGSETLMFPNPSNRQMTKMTRTDDYFSFCILKGILPTNIKIFYLEIIDQKKNKTIKLNITDIISSVCSNIWPKYLCNTLLGGGGVEMCILVLYDPDFS